ncbi:hypothetical protein BSZ19_06325 [Bradyrhizobium japonicum]|uniref:Uncharacterized protein n=1 Tax=Bradyrhizobium japonicum TaxID=375 RepID=A0A1Y2JVP9_BRAJP|nr:hypothetical protein BSZ19_06325 [Bradyrhizobium japonicum]
MSPAGKLEPKGGASFLSGETNRGYVIDGGYFENYDAVTAREAARRSKQREAAVGLIVLQISSDPTLTKERTRVRIREDEKLRCVLTTSMPAVGAATTSDFLQFRDSGWNAKTGRWEKNDGGGFVVAYLNELAAPLLGVTAVREAHGTLAAAEPAASVCDSGNSHALKPSRSPRDSTCLLRLPTLRIQHQFQDGTEHAPNLIFHTLPCARSRKTAMHRSCHH